LILIPLLSIASCRGCKESAVVRALEEKAEEGDEDEEQEEADNDRDNYWRPQISIVGAGRVQTANGTFDCRSDGVRQSGTCGPKLIRFKELEPPLLHATGEPGWKLDHWESMIRAPNGTVRSRTGPMPDGRFYLNGFGYSDTGELETVTAVFVAARDQDGPNTPHQPGGP
jgi:hypothetical protein